MENLASLTGIIEDMLDTLHPTLTMGKWFAMVLECTGFAFIFYCCALFCYCKRLKYPEAKCKHFY